ncbi:MAG: DUF6242 domain-containing protein [Dysgonamonadaceae bacterium]|jgi:hypothetical protein|nr:DUF6242 domain-containing protein [Dysgonamonadaceae bacterium]
MISVLTSCLGSDDTEVIIPIDAQITAFNISHDSVPALDSLVFSIDHFNGLIYNHDSLRYGIEIKEKVIATFSTSAYAVVDITRKEDGDSTLIASGDSLDLREVARLRVYSYSGITKEYQVKLNIHQVDPDSVRYWKIADGLSFLDADQVKSVYFLKKHYTFISTFTGNVVKLYSSSDAENWEEESITGIPGNVVVSEIRNTGSALFAYTASGQLYRSTNATSWELVTTTYPVKAVFGQIEETPTQEAGFALLVEKEGKNIPAFTPDFVEWSYGSELPENFPVSDFSSVNYVKMLLNRVTVIGGKNSSGKSQNAVWSTSNGVYWAKLTDNNRGLFPVMEGCNAFVYNGMIYLLNGRFVDDSSDDGFNKVTYCSKDGGATWQIDQEKTYLPDDYQGRFRASVVVDENNYQYIVGGYEFAGPLKEVWKGILNKLSSGN